MLNSSFLDTNGTQLPINGDRSIEIVRTVLVILAFFGFFSFLYFMKILLTVYFTTEHVRDTSRYVLFAHMLFNDMIYLLLCLLLMVCSVYLLYLPLSICYTLVAGISASFVVTPYNLAAMSIERYVAICFPLRHTQICSAHNTSFVIGFMWFLGFLPIVPEIVAMTSAISRDAFSVNVRCSNLAITITPLQVTIKSVHTLVSISLVGIILVCTYIKVILEVQKCRSSATKASKTVLLHGFQLLLCVTSLTSSFLDNAFKNNVLLMRIMFFLFFMCLPRLLSPLFYGLRDELFRKYIRKIYSRPILLMAQP